MPTRAIHAGWTCGTICRRDKVVVVSKPPSGAGVLCRILRALRAVIPCNNIKHVYNKLRGVSGGCEGNSHSALQRTKGARGGRRGAASARDASDTRRAYITLGG